MVLKVKKSPANVKAQREARTKKLGFYRKLRATLGARCTPSTDWVEDVISTKTRKKGELKKKSEKKEDKEKRSSKKLAKKKE